MVLQLLESPSKSGRFTGTDLETFEAYYDGHQPLAFASQKFRDAFGSRFRLDVLGFRELVAHPTAHAVARGLVAAMPHRMDITVCYGRGERI